MENVRLPRPAKVRIERDRFRCQVLIDGVDVSSHVTAVSWSMQAGKLPTATVTFHDVEVNVGAEDPGPSSTNIELQQKYQAPSGIVPRLRKAGLTEAADFFESVKPVVAREQVVKAPVKRTPEQWCERYGVDIRDPDGWRGKDDLPWTEPITLADFYKRASRCTIRNVVSVDWERIRRDAQEV